MIDELPKEQVERDRAVRRVFENVWPDFCKAIGLTRPRQTVGVVRAGLGAAAVLGPRRGFLGGALRSASLGASFALDDVEVPEIVGCWPSVLGPAFGIDAHWQERDRLATHMRRLAQTIGIERVTLAYVEAADAPGGRALLVMTAVTREPLREVREASWVGGRDLAVEVRPDSVEPPWWEQLDDGADEERGM